MTATALGYITLDRRRLNVRMLSGGAKALFLDVIDALAEFAGCGRPPTVKAVRRFIGCHGNRWRKYWPEIADRFVIDDTDQADIDNARIAHADIDRAVERYHQAIAARRSGSRSISRPKSSPNARSKPFWHNETQKRESVKEEEGTSKACPVSSSSCASVAATARCSRGADARESEPPPRTAGERIAAERWMPGYDDLAVPLQRCRFDDGWIAAEVERFRAQYREHTLLGWRWAAERRYIDARLAERAA